MLAYIKTNNRIEGGWFVNRLDCISSDHNVVMLRKSGIWMVCSVEACEAQSVRVHSGAAHTLLCRTSPPLQPSGFHYSGAGLALFEPLRCAPLWPSSNH
eukprot:2889914-Pyramimonas_sp.AAC.1